MLSSKRGLWHIFFEYFRFESSRIVPPPSGKGFLKFISLTTLIGRFFSTPEILNIFDPYPIRTERFPVFLCFVSTFRSDMIPFFKFLRVSHIFPRPIPISAIREVSPAANDKTQKDFPIAGFEA